MEKQNEPSLEEKFFELVLKSRLERAIGTVMDVTTYPEIPEVFEGLSFKEQVELDQKILAVIEKVLPEIILSLRNKISILAKEYEQLKKTDPFAN